ncbi:class I SAM-dependent methyltransferase [Actinoplanes couchii]|uniref:Methyltransferase domain-containing protein n=1 Tax=Actinoplanes couchii TaxID=403638 RepID=A0ABQ3XDB0_9ACTN|nr:class I SAM-dependent methyltransferase [Actinoplanes couchii]MDR6321351.1 2-polyprenyl-3-methyl-5-hydroxy-6-metoxy-1,4-benzoquinol methylase [Actinoplanes couchii]GID56461.1 hypothetical protein Aco03nite_048650 [Actinoplanes couchii]
MGLTSGMGLDFAAAYDALNADDHDYRFYAGLADEVGAGRVLDLGCGTGTLARLLASRGRTAVGIDPDPEMLRVARGKPGAEQVDWRLGRSDLADDDSADFAVMAGHVAQVFRTGEEESTRDVLAFRDAAELVRSVEEAGFAVERRYGFWDRSPLTDGSREIVLVVR